MSISKKLRFEIFKRDEFKCGYCGKSPPEAILEIDHIDSKSKGGRDDINNLFTACFDCNRGKSNIPLSKIPQRLKNNLEILKEKEIQYKEYRKFINKIEKRIQSDIKKINFIYNKHYKNYIFSDCFNNISLKRFLTFLPLHEVIDSLYIAISKFPANKDDVIPYFCGICWRKIREIQNATN